MGDRTGYDERYGKLRGDTELCGAGSLRRKSTWARDGRNRMGRCDGASRGLATAQVGISSEEIKKLLQEAKKR